MLKEPWDAMVKCLEENGDTFRKVDGEWTVHKTPRQAVEIEG